MRTIKFQCDDRYEAEKLAGLVSIQKDGTLYVDDVAAVIGNEIVIKLKDKSSHSVLLKDKETAGRLQLLLLEILSGKVKLRSSNFSESTAEVVMD